MVAVIVNWALVIRANDGNVTFQDGLYVVVVMVVLLMICRIAVELNLS